MKLALTLVVVGVVAAACGGSSASDTTPVPGPASAEAAVGDWLVALAAGDPETTAHVEQPGLLLALAAENALSVAEVTTLDESGIPDATLESYWSSFSDSLDVFAESGVESLTPRSETAIGGGVDFAAVSAAAPSSVRSTTVVAHQGDDDVWRVDVLATVGPGLVRPLTDLYNASVDSDAGAPVLALLKAAQPSLEAGLEAQGDDFPVEFRTEVLSLIADLSVIPSEDS